MSMRIIRLGDEKLNLDNIKESLLGKTGVVRDSINKLSDRSVWLADVRLGTWRRNANEEMELDVVSSNGLNFDEVVGSLQELIKRVDGIDTIIRNLNIDGLLERVKALENGMASLQNSFEDFRSRIQNTVNSLSAQINSLRYEVDEMQIYLQTIKESLNQSYVYDISYEPQSRTLAASKRNIATGAEERSEAIVPLVSEIEDGMLSANDYKKFINLLDDVIELYDQSWLSISRSPINDEAGANSAWELATESHARQGVGVIDANTGSLWKYGNLEGENQWYKISSGSVGMFTNTSLGLLKGSTKDGYVQADMVAADGSAYVSGWENTLKKNDTLTGDVSGTLDATITNRITKRTGITLAQLNDPSTISGLGDGKSILAELGGVDLSSVGITTSCHGTCLINRRSSATQNTTYEELLMLFYKGGVACNEIYYRSRHDKDAQNNFQRLAYISDIGSFDRVWTDAEMNTSTARPSNSLARRGSTGHLAAHYFNQQSANNENPTISQFFVQNSGDNFLRKASLAHVRNSLLNGSANQRVRGDGTFTSNTPGLYTPATPTGSHTQVLLSSVAANRFVKLWYRSSAAFNYIELDISSNMTYTISNYAVGEMLAFAGTTEANTSNSVAAIYFLGLERIILNRTYKTIYWSSYINNDLSACMVYLGYSGSSTVWGRLCT